MEQILLSCYSITCLLDRSTFLGTILFENIAAFNANLIFTPKTRISSFSSMLIKQEKNSSKPENYRVILPPFSPMLTEQEKVTPKRKYSRHLSLPEPEEVSPYSSPFLRLPVIMRAVTKKRQNGNGLKKKVKNCYKFKEKNL